MEDSVFPTFHWVYGRKAQQRKAFSEKFLAQNKQFSLKISEDLPDADADDGDCQPTFWVYFAGEDPPEWMLEGDTPIIQFYWTDHPSSKTIENSEGLITPYIPKPMSFTGLFELFRDSVQFWASPCFHDLQGQRSHSRLVIIEDEESQQFLMKEALNEIGLKSQAVFFENGSEALDGIKKMQSKNRDPLLLFLDLMLPGMGGDEVLKAMKSSAELKSIPVALLTGAQSTEELSFLSQMPKHLSFRLPLLETDASDLIRRCLNFFKHAKPIP